MSIEGFIHVACMGDYQKIAGELFDATVKSGLLAKCRRVNVVKLGIGKLDLPDGFHLALEDEDLTRYEYPTLRLAWEFSQNNDAEVWYVHTKGTSKTAETWDMEKKFWADLGVHLPSLEFMVNNTTEWRRFMSYFMLNRYRDCLRVLEHVDVCGVAYRPKPVPHYSGNFWWSKSDYLRTLPDPEEIRQHSIDVFGRDRHMAEFWVGWNDPVVADLFPFKHNLYVSGIKPKLYRPQTKFL